MFVALALFAPASAFAQQGTAEVRGRVLDAQQAALPGVTVTVRNQDTGMFRETVANADGTYFIAGIVPGRYEVTASLQGFSTFLRRDVVLEVGKTTSLDIPLAIGSVTESVTVVGETSLV
ncbi:MAG: carboxypeptidase regulatory-like domain-containing protein, partial [Acidobacteria bacterium]|nr:carboxypeptidase regulatory-like domain-containing protein [Acidobacteriota bacterium]